jgi:hypothetical protein
MAAAVGVGPIWIVGERPGRALLDRFIDRAGAGEHDLEAGFLQAILDGEAHPAADHDVAVADRVDQVVVSTVVPRVLMITAVGRADVAEFPDHLDAVCEVNDDEGFGTAEVRSNGVPVQGGKCDSHALQDTGDSQRIRQLISHASPGPMA